MHPEIEQFKDWLTCQYPTSSTSVHYTNDLVLFFSFTGKLPSEITSQDVESFIAHSQQKGHTATTINRRLAALNIFFYFQEMIEDQRLSSPVKPRHFLPQASPLPRNASENDLARLLAAINNPREKAVILIMLDCGLRVGEIHNLSLDDFFKDYPPRLSVRGKGDKLRTVPLSPLAQDALQEWLNCRPVTTDRAVFISRNNKRLSISGIQSALREICRKTGLNLTCHQFRHTFGRRMAEAGMSVTSLQKLLGHESLRTTQIYVHLSNPHLHAEYDQAMLSILDLLA